MPDLAALVVDRLNRLYGDLPRPIPLHAPVFGAEEEEAVGACIRDGWVSSVGPDVAVFERGLAERVGARCAVAVVNGTAALHVALAAMGIGSGDEVLVPALTFVATANAVSLCGATPHFIDCEEKTFGLDPDALDARLQATAAQRNGSLVNMVSGKRIAALVPVHLFGTPADMDRLKKVGERWALPIVEDAAEALGSRCRGRSVGRHGHASVFSFNGNKIVTTGGGGAVLTDDEAFAASVRHLSTTGKRPHPWRYDHDVAAFNYRLPNLNAALGVAQLARLDVFLDLKRRLLERYVAAFADVEGLSVHRPPEGSESNVWLTALMLERPDPDARDAVLSACHAAGILSRPCWTPLHRLPMYRSCPAGPLAVTESLAARIVNLPSGVGVARHVG